MLFNLLVHLAMLFKHLANQFDNFKAFADFRKIMFTLKHESKKKFQTNFNLLLKLKLNKLVSVFTINHKKLNLPFVCT